MLQIAAIDRIHNRTPINRAEVYRKIVAGYFQGFVFPKGSVIISGLYTDGVVTVYGAAGNMQELLEALPCLERWYRAKGGLRMEIHGRLGWARMLKPQGYTRADTCLRKEL